MQPVHPGETLRDELDELGLSANALSRALGVGEPGDDDPERPAGRERGHGAGGRFLIALLSATTDGMTGTNAKLSAAARSTARFHARAVRDPLLKRGRPDDGGFIRFAYRPFDTRWFHWEADSELLDRSRRDYRPHVFEENSWLILLRAGVGFEQSGPVGSRPPQ